MRFGLPRDPAQIALLLLALATLPFASRLVRPGPRDRLFVALTNELRALGVTTVCSVEIPNQFGAEVEVQFSGNSANVDGMLLLRYVELRSQLYRLVSIVKARVNAYDSSIREFRITAQGIEVADTFDSAEAILTGVARLLPARYSSQPPPLGEDQP